MRIKAIFMDLDNTLLRSDKSVSDYTRSILDRCREQGIKVAFATARPLRAVDWAVGHIPHDGLVYHSGVVVTCEGRELLRHSIPTDTAMALAADILRVWPEAALSLEIEDSLLCNFDATVFWPGIAYTAADFSAPPQGAIDKLVVSHPIEGGMGLPQQMIEALPAMVPQGLSLTHDRGGAAMITAEGASKIGGVLALCTHWGIPLLYAAAFGDDMSDLSMLQNVGWGVAVENALPQVKATADFICGSNEADGVARWLEEHVLSAL